MYFFCFWCFSGLGFSRVGIFYAVWVMLGLFWSSLGQIRADGTWAGDFSKSTLSLTEKMPS